MILTGLSLFFAWMAVRLALRLQPGTHAGHWQDYGFVVLMALLAIVCAWTPLSLLHFENKLTRHASLMAGREADVHCNSPFDAILDSAFGRIGHANFDTGDIVLQYGWCDNLMSYLDAPEQVDERERYSLVLLTHEIMHVRGERNEQLTECQAIQFNPELGRRLGLSEALVTEHTREYFLNEYKHHPYFSPDCGPGKPYDQQINDRVWGGDGASPAPAL